MCRRRPDFHQLLVILSIMIAVCATMANSIAVDGEWSFWSEWSSCSATCEGGSQSRQRKCNDPAPSGGGLDCPSEGQQTQVCADWDCPDCLMSCPDEGTINTACSLCECDVTTPISGRVWDGQIYPKLPLADVKIFASTKRWQSLAVSDCAGHFTLPAGLCRQQLQLRFIKEGYYTETELYAVPAVGEMVVKMPKTVPPTLISHPVSVAVRDGGHVSFSCTSSLYQKPPVHTYQWYHNDVLVGEQEAVPGVAILTGTFTINNIQPSDAGHYYCRAVSDSGSTASRQANLLYLSEEGTPSATCELDTEKGKVFLHSTCMVDGMKVSSYFAGACLSNSGDGGPDFGCCQPDRMDVLNVTCGDANYQLTKVASCGWTPCEKKGLVWVEGVERLNQPENPTDTLASRFTSLNFPNRPSSTEKLSYYSRNTGDHFPHLTSINLREGIYRYRLAVDLRGKPTARNVSSAQVVEYQLPDYSPNKSVGQLLIPGGYYQTLNGNTITGDVSLYLDMADIHGTSGFRTLPGQMMLEQGGQHWLLKTYGLLWLNVFHARQDAVPSCYATLNLEGCAVHLTKSTLKSWPQTLMMLDSTKGTWLPSATLESQSKCIAEGRMHFPPSLPVVNIAQPYKRDKLCELAVYVYGTSDTSQPLPGELVAVDSKTKNGDRLLSHFRQFTGVDGKACLLVPCRKLHTVTVLSTFEAKPSDEHFLPNKFSFTNTETTVTIKSPKKSKVTGSAGPVHRYTYHSCQQSTTSQYHLKFHMVDAPMPDHLSVVQPWPHNYLSWYEEEGKSHGREACFVRIGIKTLSRSSMQVSGMSRRDGTEGSYGTALTGVQPVYSNMADHGDSFSCLEVRCSNVHLSPTDPPARDTFVDVHLHQPTNMTCKLSWLSPYLQEPLDSSEFGDRLPPVHILSATNSSLILRINAISYSDDFDNDYYIPGFYRLRSSYEEALFRTHADCLKDEKALLALFDCSEGQVTSHWWDEPNVPGEIYGLEARNK